MIVTGATSFLGRALCEKLKSLEQVELYPLRHSIEEAKALPEKAEAFVHLAWAGVGSAGRSDRSIQDYNVEMSMAALKTASELGCSRFLFAGSQAEYGGAALDPEGLQREDARCMPKSEYGKAKLFFGQLGSRWVRARNEEEEGELRFLHLRFFSVYGPGDHGTSLISTCLRNFQEDSPMELGPCSQDWDYMYIADAVEAMTALLLSETAEGIYNVASGDIRPLRSYVEELRELMGSKSPLCFGARGDNAEGAVSLRPSVERLRKACGFAPRYSFREGIWQMLTPERKDRPAR